MPLEPLVLVVEDDPDVLGLVAAALAREGIAVARAGGGAEAVTVFEAERPDLVLLDLMMPGVGGLEVLDRIRASATTPVILLTAVGDENSRVAGLQRGADDYIVKPFSTRELVARVQAVLRRSAAAKPPPAKELSFPGLRIDLAGREVFVDEVVVELTAKEFELLAFLASTPGTVFSRRELLERVWRSSSEWQQESTVTEHVRRLRQKIECDAEHPTWLHTVRGAGYRFDRRTAGKAGPPAG